MKNRTKSTNIHLAILSFSMFHKCFQMNQHMSHHQRWLKAQNLLTWVKYFSCVLAARCPSCSNQTFSGCAYLWWLNITDLTAWKRHILGYDWLLPSACTWFLDPPLVCGDCKWSGSRTSTVKLILLAWKML